MKISVNSHQLLFEKQIIFLLSGQFNFNLHKNQSKINILLKYDILPEYRVEKQFKTKTI